MARLRSTLLILSLTLLVAWVAISAKSILAIEQSKTAISSSDYLPAIPTLQTNQNLDSSITISKPDKGSLIGRLEIPRLKKIIPIYEGTDNEQLKLGAGHYEKSVLPGFPDNSVIAGHRDSVFAKFGTLKLGDKLIVSTDYGNFTYNIVFLRVVNADDRTVIVPTKEAILTLRTCYPFRFIGNATKRFIVTAKLVTP